MKHANLKRFSRTSALVVALGILASQGAPVEAVLRKDQRKAMNTYVLEQVKKYPEFWSRGAFEEDREALRLVLLVRAICAFDAVPELRYVPEREQDGIAENTVGYLMGGEGRVPIRVAAEKGLGGAFAGGVLLALLTMMGRLAALLAHCNCSAAGLPAAAIRRERA